jgi:hypothetical protein
MEGASYSEPDPSASRSGIKDESIQGQFRTLAERQPRLVFESDFQSRRCTGRYNLVEKHRRIEAKRTCGAAMRPAGLSLYSADSADRLLTRDLTAGEATKKSDRYRDRPIQHAHARRYRLHQVWHNVSACPRLGMLLRPSGPRILLIAHRMHMTRKEAPYRVVRGFREKKACEAALCYMRVISRSFVSGRKIRPMTKLIAATTIGYQSPE